LNKIKIKYIHLLEQNQDKINWVWLSKIPNAIHLLEQNQDKIDWESLSKNPNAIHLLEQNQGKIKWSYLSLNPNIFIYDYKKIKERKQSIHDELMENLFHPDRIAKFLKDNPELGMGNLYDLY
jgi:hypothetical protein